MTTLRPFSFAGLLSNMKTVSDAEVERMQREYYALDGIYCLTCHGSGMEVVEEEYWDQFDKAIKAHRVARPGCPECGKGKETEEEAIARRLRASGIPETHQRDMTFESWDDNHNPAAKRLVQAWAKRPIGGLVLAGGVGVGKTHLSVAAATASMRLGYTWHWTDVRALMNRLNAAVAAGMYQPELQWVKDVPVLCLDDYGAERTQDKGGNTYFAADAIEELLSDRFANERPFLVTTNVAGRQLPPRLASRFSDRSRVSVVKFDNVDYRRLLR